MSAAFDWMTDLWADIRFTWLSIPALWRVINGGWHVWRDSPDWVVARAAELFVEGSGDPACIEAVAQARAEWALRDRK